MPRATIVQIKRRAEEAAAETVSLAAKRSKAAGSGSSSPVAGAAGDSGQAADGDRSRHVLKRLHSVSQAQYDQGAHLSLLRQLRQEQPAEFVKQGVKTAPLQTTEARAKRRETAARNERFRVVEKRRLTGDEQAGSDFHLLEIETVGVQAERRMRETQQAMQSLGVTMDGRPMQSRILTPQEQAEREELIAARRAATQVAPPSIDSVPIGAPLPQYLRETVEPDAGQYVYDFYVAYLDQPEGAGDVDLTVEEWAAEEDPQEAAERAQDLDEDSNDEDYYANDYPERDPDADSSEGDGEDDDFFGRRRKQNFDEDEEDEDEDGYRGRDSEGDDMYDNQDRDVQMSRARENVAGGDEEEDSDDGGHGMDSLRAQWKAYKTSLTQVAARDGTSSDEDL